MTDSQADALTCDCCGITHEETLDSFPDRPLRIREVAQLRTAEKTVFAKSPMSVSPDQLDIDDTEPYTTVFVIGTTAVARTVSYHPGVGWVVEATEKIPEQGDPKNIAMNLFTATAERLEELESQLQPED